jgi:hypothetical protein
MTANSFYVGIAVANQAEVAEFQLEISALLEPLDVAGLEGLLLSLVDERVNVEEALRLGAHPAISLR